MFVHENHGNPFPTGAMRELRSGIFQIPYFHI